ncbi:helix-turn-helix transcriptional regulator [Massilia sp. IC2-278]|uniref:AraC family transcriptional regulator n=1 Tax=Massilia sp. IC2-278 TaxID=2887200 RepID=UPI001E33F3F0|nr:helix-turn-helix transcriptional regulator [Massilia sp. IC2-278]MCC2963601.1 helix-turn-helix transcriptional regulator [Massilia sp. IC2-278]
MKHRQTDIALRDIEELRTFRALPRPVYGHALGLPNRAIGQRHCHPWAQLSYAARGVIEVITDTARYMAPPLHAIWIPAGAPHAVHSFAGTEIRSLYIQPTALAEAAGACRVVEVTPLLRELIRTFSGYPAEYDEASAHGRLVGVLLDQLACAPEADLALPWPGDPRLRTICRALEAQLDSDKRLLDHALELGVSEKTLSRLFLQQTGLTFRAWRQRLRILAALPMLERGDRVTDVAVVCGYDSMSAFIAAFRAFTGVTPGDMFPRGSS